MNEENSLSPKEVYELKKKEKTSLKKKKTRIEKINKAPKRIVKIIINLFIAGIVLYAIYWMLSFIPNLPPSTSQNHSENSPGSYILTTPMSDSIQRHMLEHSNGNGIPGRIIQYNCEDYECSSDLVSKLTDLVKSYDSGVYLAPNRYDGKIILTKEGGRLILDSFDEVAMRNFIGL